MRSKAGLRERIAALAPAILPKGVGAYSAAVLFYEMRGFERFTNRRQVGGFMSWDSSKRWSRQRGLDQPLFRAAIGRTGKLSERSMSRVDAWYMVRRRARNAGIETAIGNHSFRAIGITDYLERGGDINIAKRMAGHSNVKRRNSTTGAATK